jgi:hypothetical protein
MTFTIKRHSDLNFNEEREIATLEELLALMDEFKDDRVQIRSDRARTRCSAGTFVNDGDRPLSM